MDLGRYHTNQSPKSTCPIKGQTMCLLLWGTDKDTVIAWVGEGMGGVELFAVGMKVNGYDDDLGKLHGAVN